MNRKTLLLTLTASMLALPLVLAGCDHEVSRTERTRTRSDGTAVHDETVVRQAPDGTVTKEHTEHRSSNP